MGEPRAVAAEQVGTERQCGRCGQSSVPWSAPSPLWNQVIRGGSINGAEGGLGGCCLTCFAELAEQRGIATGWRLYATDVKVPLQTITPSGRVWDDDLWLFVDHAEPAV